VLKCHDKKSRHDGKNKTDEKRLQKDYGIHRMILWNLIPDKDPEFAG
jgi:hypothetical protein